MLEQAHGSLKRQDQQRLEQIVPAATLAAAERAAEAKELTTKPRRQLPDQAQIFADGFAIGLAVLLEVEHICWVGASAGARWPATCPQFSIVSVTQLQIAVEACSAHCSKLPDIFSMPVFACQWMWEYNMIFWC